MTSSHMLFFSAENGKNKTRLKTILYWNEFYGRYDTYDFGFGHEAFLEKNCAVSNCFATKVNTFINQFRHLVLYLDKNLSFSDLNISLYITRMK